VRPRPGEIYRFPGTSNVTGKPKTMSTAAYDAIKSEEAFRPTLVCRQRAATVLPRRLMFSRFPPFRGVQATVRYVRFTSPKRAKLKSAKPAAASPRPTSQSECASGRNLTLGTRAPPSCRQETKTDRGGRGGKLLPQTAETMLSLKNWRSSGSPDTASFGWSALSIFLFAYFASGFNGRAK